MVEGEKTSTISHVEHHATNFSMSSSLTCVRRNKVLPVFLHDINRLHSIFQRIGDQRPVEFLVRNQSILISIDFRHDVVRFVRIQSNIEHPQELLELIVRQRSRVVLVHHFEEPQDTLVSVDTLTYDGKSTEHVLFGVSF